MVLTEKELSTLQDLKTQEQACVTKYSLYEEQARDQVLKDLFHMIVADEKNHLDTISNVLEGKSVPDCNCNDAKGKIYEPKATYACGPESDDKKHDCFLATDCIGTEKLVSGEYNSDVFVFGDSKMRKLLADIQIEEQNHAEMLWKYKSINCMS